VGLNERHILGEILCCIKIIINKKEIHSFPSVMLGGEFPSRSDAFTRNGPEGEQILPQCPKESTNFKSLYSDYSAQRVTEPLIPLLSIFYHLCTVLPSRSSLIYSILNMKRLRILLLRVTTTSYYFLEIAVPPYHTEGTPCCSLS